LNFVCWFYANETEKSGKNAKKDGKTLLILVSV